MKHIGRLTVGLDIGGNARRLGTLAWKADERRAYFEYDRAFLRDPLPLSPFTLKIEPGVKAAPYTPFDGLHGLFSDSLPDGWGRRLLDRRLAKAGIDHRLLTPLDRLAFVGAAGMGALRYEPAEDFDDSVTGSIDVDFLAAQADLVQRDIAAADIDTLQAIQGGSGGVRPKIMVGMDATRQRVVPDFGQTLPAGFDHWMIKFRATDDPADIGAEEFAYALMAREAGIDMPETHLIDTASGARYFAVRRFDRPPAGRTHFQSAAGLVDADYRTPSIDYGTLLKITNLLTRDARHVKHMFRRMLFNVLSHNRDDHAKNHAFMMDGSGGWRPTPAFDLTFSNGPAGEHNLAVAGEGRAPGLSHIRQVARDAALAAKEADGIYEQVRAVIARWPEFAQQAGVSQQRLTDIGRALNPG